METLTAEQEEMVAQGIDKRCKMLIVASARKVAFEPDGVRIEGIGLVFLPVGYRIRDEYVPPSGLAAGCTHYHVQHESFAWVGEGKVYPVIELRGWD